MRTRDPILTTILVVLPLLLAALLFLSLTGGEVAWELVIAVGLLAAVGFLRLRRAAPPGGDIEPWRLQLWGVGGVVAALAGLALYAPITGGAIRWDRGLALLLPSVALLALLAWHGRR